MICFISLQQSISSYAETIINFMLYKYYYLLDESELLTLAIKETLA